MGSSMLKGIHAITGFLSFLDIMKYAEFYTSPTHQRLMEMIVPKSCMKSCISLAYNIRVLPSGLHAHQAKKFGTTPKRIF